MTDPGLEKVEAAVWRAIATKAAHQNERLETDLRAICEQIRRVHQQLKTVVVPTDFPADYDLGFPARIVRSPYCPERTAYVIPAESELNDLLTTYRGRANG